MDPLSQTAQSEIGQAFQMYLGRQPSAAEVSQWMTWLQGNVFDFDAMRGLIRNQPDARIYISQWVQAQYYAFTGADPAPDDRDGWVALIQAGNNPDRLIANLQRIYPANNMPAPAAPAPAHSSGFDLGGTLFQLGNFQVKTWMALAAAAAAAAVAMSS